MRFEVRGPDGEQLANRLRARDRRLSPTAITPEVDGFVSLGVVAIAVALGAQIGDPIVGLVICS